MPPDSVHAPPPSSCTAPSCTLEAFEFHDGQSLLLASAKDDEPVSIRPFDAITFSLGALWP